MLHFYRLNSNSNTLFDKEEDSDMKIKQIPSMFGNNLKEYIKMRSMVSNPSPSISQEEEQELVSATKNLCDEKRDIFEQFYNDNSEIYDEILSNV